MMRMYGLSLVLLGLLVAGCGQPTRSTPGVRPAQSAPVVPRRAMLVGRDTVQVEVAASEPMRTVGLMYRTSMPVNDGMLFVFDQEGIYPFWMRNTEIPLSIAFIDRAGVIADIQDMAPHDEITHHAPPRPILYALELNQGWFAAHRVKVGDTARLLP